MSENNGHQPEAISEDDLDSLKFLIGEYEKAQYALQSLQRHIAGKYKLTDGASIDIQKGGTIMRALVPPAASLG